MLHPQQSDNSSRNTQHVAIHHRSKSLALRIRLRVVLAIFSVSERTDCDEDPVTDM